MTGLRPWRKAAGSGSSPDETVSVGRKKKKKKKKILNAAVVVLKESLFALRDSADACPPLKSATGGLAHIVNVLETMKGNKEEAMRIVQRINALLDLLEDLVPDCTKINDSLFKAIAGLDSELNKISADVVIVPQGRWLKRYFKASEEIGQLCILREQLDVAMEHFKLSASIRTEIAVEDLKIAVNQALDTRGSLSVPLADIPYDLIKIFAFTNLYRGSTLSH